MSQHARTILTRLEQVDSLPPMPDVAQKILGLKDDEFAGSREIANIIKVDPTLAGQIIRYASSPIFGAREPVSSIHEAVIRLGFVKVMNLALGLSLGKSFDLPQNGPLGLRVFWRHAIFSAFTMQLLAENYIKWEKRPTPGIAYLIGLIHNIGYLILGHLFRPAYDALVAGIQRYPQHSLLTLEEKGLGVTHAQIGATLLKYWGMPPEVVAAVHDHHNENCKSDYRNYAYLTMVVDCILKHYAIGDAPSEEIPEKAMKLLGLEQHAVDEVHQQILEKRGELEGMVDSLTATG